VFPPGIWIIAYHTLEQASGAWGISKRAMAWNWASGV
jgi:hypothetical protein